MDAALLMPALRGAVPHDDPRSTATMAAVLEDLCEEHFIYRFRHDEARIHVNEWTRELAKLMPEWFKEVKAVEETREEDAT